MTAEPPTMTPFTRHVLICTGEACNGQQMVGKLGHLLGDLTEPGSPCRVKVSAMACSEGCEGGPVMAVYPEGIWYHHIDDALLARIVEEHLKNDQPVAEAILYRTGDPTCQPTTNTAPPQRRSTKPGLVLVNTGEGKGKSTAAFGVILRMLGRKKRVALIQFLKHEGGRWGEIRALEQLGLEAEKTGDGWTWTSTDLDETQAKALHGWELAKARITSDDYDLVVLDEFTYLLDFGWLDTTEVLTWLQENKPERLNLIITGRGAPQALVDYADTVTNMTKVKHAYDAGIQARAGIEF